MSHRSRDAKRRKAWIARGCVPYPNVITAPTTFPKLPWIELPDGTWFVRDGEAVMHVRPTDDPLAPSRKAFRYYIAVGQETWGHGESDPRKAKMECEKHLKSIRKLKTKEDPFYDKEDPIECAQ